MQTQTNNQRPNPAQRVGSNHSTAPSLPADLPDEQALWLQYKDKLYPLVLAYVQKLVSDPVVTEEVTTLAFLRLWENRHSVSGEKQVLAFLFMVSRTRVMNMMRLKAIQLQKH